MMGDAIAFLGHQSALSTCTECRDQGTCISECTLDPAMCTLYTTTVAFTCAAHHCCLLPPLSTAGSMSAAQIETLLSVASGIVGLTAQPQAGAAMDLTSPSTLQELQATTTASSSFSVHDSLPTH